jgi:hypothetical protein
MPDFSNIPNVQAITVYVSANNSKLKWPIYEVRKITGAGINAVVRALETTNNTRLAVSDDNIAIQTEAMMQDAYLTLVNGNEEVISSVPLAVLNPSYYNGNIFMCTYNDIDWSRSFIQFSRTTNLPAPGAERVVPIIVYYTADNI